ncbi:MAG: hypothetical protein ACT4ON_10115 [Bacteroidota bacterium]
MKYISYKKYLFIFSILFSLKNCFAQDTIIKSNNERVIAKILEITAKEVKYKKFNFLDGPTYVENKSDLQIIKYSNGSTEKFQSASTPIQTPVVVKRSDSVSKTTEPAVTDDYYQPGKAHPVASSKQAPVITQKKDSVTKSEKTAGDDYYEGSQKNIGTRSGQLSISKRGFKHNEAAISEKEFYSLLKQTNDKEIINLVEKAGRAKKRQYIFFICMVGNTTMIFVPAVFIFVQPAFIFPYFRNSAVRKTCNKKAAELYNKKF